MLTGKNYEEIKNIIKDKNCRVVRIDKDSFIITDDYEPTRMNLSIDNGVITKVTFG